MRNWWIEQYYNSALLKLIYNAFINRTIREKRLIVVSLLLLSGYLVSNQTLIPVYDYYQHEKKRAEAAENLYLKLYNNAHLVAQPQHQQDSLQARNSLELRNSVTTTLRRIGLTPEVISREGQNQLRLSFSNIPYEKVAAWFTELNKADVRIDNAQIQSVSPGIVNINLVLD
ncbi:type II secretion system protein GspM [Marinomonas sp. THO17]|uniref:type II secretion system protein GspM n=1 Tax=Marinomonas sp. THO17 TaxID=3149048 RepID=UPI00336BF6FA